MAILSRDARGLRPGKVVGGLLDRIQSRAGAYFPDLGPRPTARIEATRRPAYSELHHVVLRGERNQERRLVLKRFAGAPAQFRALEAVWPHFATHPQWGVPRPLDVWDDGPTLVMESVPGRSLHALLPRVCWVGRGLAQATRRCERSGAWLRFYHDIGAEAGVVPLSADKRHALRGSLEALVRVGFDPDSCRHLAARADRVSDRAAESRLKTSHVHGEFTVDNVFVDGPRIIGLDLWATHRGSAAQDLASFLGSLTLLRLTRPLPARALLRLRAAFLAGYFGRPVSPPAAVTLLEMIALADSALEIADRRTSPLARWWVRRIVTAALDRLAADGASADGTAERAR